MKKVKIISKLSLNKETVAKLNDNQMKAVFGGGKSQLQNTYTCTTNYSAWVCTSAFGCTPC